MNLNHPGELCVFSGVFALSLIHCKPRQILSMQVFASRSQWVPDNGVVVQTKPSACADRQGLAAIVNTITARKNPVHSNPPEIGLNFIEGPGDEVLALHGFEIEIPRYEAFLSATGISYRLQRFIPL